MKENVARIRRLLEESVREKKQLDAEERSRRAFELFEFNTSLPAVDTSARARGLRTVARIVGWYVWAGPEVARQLDRRGVATVDDLDDDQVVELVARMRQLEECAQEGLDSPDAPVAR